MSQSTGNAIAILVAGIIIGAVAAWRLYSGRSYSSHPAAQFSRKQDPFLFWLTVGPLVLLALFLVGSAAVLLVPK